MIAFNDLPSAAEAALGRPILRVKTNRDTLYIMLDGKLEAVEMLTYSEEHQRYEIKP